MVIEVPRLLYCLTWLKRDTVHTAYLIQIVSMLLIPLVFPSKMFVKQHFGNVIYHTFS
jgi:hypothetical protein